MVREDEGGWSLERSAADGAEEEVEDTDETAAAEVILRSDRNQANTM